MVYNHGVPQWYGRKVMTDPNLTDAQIAAVWAYAESNNLIDGDDFDLDGNNFLCFTQTENRRTVFVNVVWVYTV